MTTRLLGPAVALCALLSACTTLPADRGWSTLPPGPQGDARFLDPDARAESLDWLQAPLTPQTAVRVALVRNPQMRTLYAELGLAGSEVLDAGRLANPVLEMGRLQGDEPGHLFTVGLAQSFTRLLLMPARQRAARAEYAATKLAVAQGIRELAMSVEAAYVEAQAARQYAVLMEAIAEAADAARELAERFHAAGNINRLELALERAEALEARTAADAAWLDAADARLHLDELMGLAPDQVDWRLASWLPEPAASIPDTPRLQAMAADHRLDVMAARTELRVLAERAGIVRVERWLDDLEIGIELEREPDGERLSGPTLGWAVPIFDQGQGELTHARAELEQAQAEFEALQREAVHAVARHAHRVRALRNRADLLINELIPVRQEIVSRMQENVNFMLDGVFELIQTRKQEYAVYGEYLETVRDYWLARIELSAATGGQLPVWADAGPETAAIPRAAAPTMNHDMHNDHGVPAGHGGEQ